MEVIKVKRLWRKKQPIFTKKSTDGNEIKKVKWQDYNKTKAVENKSTLVNAVLHLITHKQDKKL